MWCNTKTQGRQIRKRKNHMRAREKREFKNMRDKKTEREWKVHFPLMQPTHTQLNTI